MSWLRLHPYAAACALAGILIIVGALIVERRTSARVGSLTVWGSNGAPLLNPSSYTPNAVLNEMQPNGGTDVPSAYIPPNPIETASTGTEPSSIDDLLASLMRPYTPSGTVDRTAYDTGAAYGFIPSGLISTSTPTRERTEEQRALFNYGNDAAAYIQTYEDAHKNAPVLLRDQAEDRQNPQKAAAVKTIAAAIRTVGEGLASMENVPPIMQSAHNALATSYLKAGEALARVPDAESDESFISAIEAYNASADALVKNYVALSSIFGLGQVSFSSSDTGSLFIFSGGGSL